MVIDSVRGSHSPLLVSSGAGSPELGDEIGDKSILRGIKGGYFKTYLLWSIVVPEDQRKPILGVNLEFFRSQSGVVCLFTGVLPRPFRSLCPYFPVFPSPDSKSLAKVNPQKKFYIHSIYPFAGSKLVWFLFGSLVNFPYLCSRKQWSNTTNGKVKH